MTEKDIYFRIPPVQWDFVGHSAITMDRQHFGYQLKNYRIAELKGGRAARIGYLDSGASRYHSRTSGELENLVESKSFTGANGWDENGHGAAVHSVMAARDNGVGLLGVDPDAEVYSAQIFNRNGSGSHRDIARGLEWLASLDLDAINFSGGSPQTSRYLLDAASEVIKSGQLLFASSGNDGRRNDVDRPAGDPQWSAIGSHNWELKRSRFSDSGPELVCDSPGESIYMCNAGPGFSRGSGTSFSSPFTAACFGRVRRKEVEVFGEVKTKTPEDVRALVNRFPSRQNGILMFDIHSCFEWMDAQTDQPTVEWETTFVSNNQSFRVQERRTK